MRSDQYLAHVLQLQPVIFWLVDVLDLFCCVASARLTRQQIGVVLQVESIPVRTGSSERRWAH
jgi:hypothetical protein